MTSPWPFHEARNTAVFTTIRVMKNGRPILYVTHDLDDGSWQFLDGDVVTLADAMVVALSEVIEKDCTLSELADLPIGYIAIRATQEDPWQRMRKSSPP